MPTNFYFNNYENSTEQQLLDDLTVESIEIYGQDMYYIPRTLKTPDPLMGESPIAEFNEAYMVPVYIQSVDGFSGEGNFLGRFGLEIRDQVTFVVAMKAFQDEVASQATTATLTRPREGDLIYFPMHKRAFQIQFVDQFQIFYQLGSLHSWKMTCELFEYSSERFNTGIAEIDALEQKYSADILHWAVYNEEGDYIITEDPDNDVWVDEEYGFTRPTEDSGIIQQESNTFVQQQESDIFSGGKI